MKNIVYEYYKQRHLQFDVPAFAECFPGSEEREMSRNVPVAGAVLAASVLLVLLISYPLWSDDTGRNTGLPAGNMVNAQQEAAGDTGQDNGADERQEMPEAGRDVGSANPMPMVLVPPQYPAGAISRGIAGWVHVRFTVNENGRPVDPSVVNSCAIPPDGDACSAELEGIFDESALNAIGEFYYRPGVDETGQRIPAPGVEYVFRYQID